MSEIRVNIDFNYYPSASEECRTVLLKLGYHSFRIIGHTGSHHADIYFFGSDEGRFKEELLDNTIIGTHRKFYFSKSYSSFGNENVHYNVGYSIRRNI